MRKILVSLAVVLLLPITLSGAVTLPLWPNEPAGFVTKTDWDFSAFPPTGLWATTGSTNLSVIDDPTAPGSPPKVTQYSYPIGFSGTGIGPGQVYYEQPALLAGVREFFLGFAWKPSDPWQGHSSGVNKLLYIAQAGAGCSRVALQVFTMFGTNAPSTGGPFYIRATDQFSDVSGYESINRWSNVGTGQVALGAWHRIEIYRKMSTTPTTSDGILRFWVDGVLAGNYTAERDPACGLTGFYVNPTWGGTNDGPKVEQDYFWYDALHVSVPATGRLSMPTSLSVK